MGISGFRLAIAAGITAFAATVPASAEMVSASNPASVKAVLDARGWPAKMNTPGDQNPYIESSQDGMKFLVLFMSCDDTHKNCTTIQYYMGFNDAKDTTLETLNEWNKTKRFARAYRDKDGDPVLEMDLDLDLKGIPAENVDQSLDTWAALMNAYHAHIFGGTE